MHRVCCNTFPVSLFFLAQILITPKDSISLAFPSLTFIKPHCTTCFTHLGNIQKYLFPSFFPHTQFLHLCFFFIFYTLCYINAFVSLSIPFRIILGYFVLVGANPFSSPYPPYFKKAFVLTKSCSIGVAFSFL